MEKVSVIYKGVYHYVMNCEMEGSSIFPSDSLKEYFLKLLKKKSKNLKI